MDHEDDDLIQRLQALGDRLDERREQVAGGEAGTRAAESRPRRLAWVAVLLVIVAIAAAAVLVGRDRDETVRTARTTTTTTTAPELDPAEVEAFAAVLRERNDQAVADCTTAAATSTTSDPDVPVDEEEFTLVGIGPGCLKGWIRGTAMAGDDLIPVHPTPESADVIGYWLPDAGWVTLEDARDPDFDPALVRAAADLAESGTGAGG